MTLFVRCLLVLLAVFHPPVSARPPAKPATFLLNGELLRLHKEKIQKGDTRLRKALDAVLKTAEKTLSSPAYSVMQKTRNPPSGDKHDYMSVGPYWWPDPTKPDGLPYIRKDGQVNPERSAIPDADNFKKLVQDVQVLTVSYYFTEEERFARRAAELLRVWFLDEATRMNPHLKYGQAIPGITEGRGIGLIDTRGLATLTDAVQLLKSSRAWSARDEAGMQNWARQFLDWMQTSPIGRDEEDEHNNHGTYYDLQAVALALYTGNQALARQILEQKTTQRIASQLKPDGSQPHELARTLSWNYSLMNLTGFFGLAQLAENVKVDLWTYQTPDGKSIRKAYEWMLPFAEGKKPWTHQQIKALHPEEFAPLRVVAAARFAEPNETPVKEPEDSFFVLTHSLF